MEEGFSREVEPIVSKNSIGDGRLKIEPDRMPKIRFEESIGELSHERGLVGGIPDEGELDFVLLEIDKALNVAKESGLFIIRGDLLLFDRLSEESDGSIDRWVVHFALGDCHRFMRTEVKKADGWIIRRSADGELCFGAPAANGTNL